MGQTHTPADETRPIYTVRPSSHWAIIGIFWLMALGVLTIAQGLFVPLVAALMLALTFSPVRRGLRKFGVGSGPAAAIIILSLVAAGVALGFGVSGTMQERFVNAPDLIEAVGDRIEAINGSIEPVMQAGDQIKELTQAEDTEVMVVREPGFLAGLQRAAPIVAGQVILCLTLAFFLIASGDMFYEKLVQVMPKLQDKKRALAIAREIEGQLSVYLLTITAINACLGVAVGFAMWALGMPDPVAFGLAAFLLNYIPYIGALVGVAVSALVSLMTHDTTMGIIVPPLVYWALTTFEGQFITPIMVGRRLRLNAVVVFISFALWAWLWGFMGMLLSTPMLLALKVISDEVPRMQSLGKFLGERGYVSKSDRLILKYVLRRPQVKPEPVGEAKPETSVANAA